MDPFYYYFVLQVEALYEHYMLKSFASNLNGLLVVLLIFSFAVRPFDVILFVLALAYGVLLVRKKEVNYMQQV